MTRSQASYLGSQVNTDLSFSSSGEWRGLQQLSSSAPSTDENVTFIRAEKLLIQVQLRRSQWCPHDKVILGDPNAINTLHSNFRIRLHLRLLITDNRVLAIKQRNETRVSTSLSRFCSPINSPVSRINTFRSSAFSRRKKCGSMTSRSWAVV